MKRLLEKLLGCMQTIHLRVGNHPDNVREKCAMEAVAFLAGEKHTDYPACACPIIGAFVRGCNDRFSQAERDEYLLPMLWDFVGTATNDRNIKQQRAYIAADYAVRVFAPMALDAAGRHDEANGLRSLTKIVDRETALAEKDKAHAAAHAAHAADAAAYAANRKQVCDGIMHLTNQDS